MEYPWTTCGFRWTDDGRLEWFADPVSADDEHQRLKAEAREYNEACRAFLRSQPQSVTEHIWREKLRHLHERVVSAYKPDGHETSGQ